MTVESWGGSSLWVCKHLTIILYSFESCLLIFLTPSIHQCVYIYKYSMGDSRLCYAIPKYLWKTVSDQTAQIYEICIKIGMKTWFRTMLSFTFLCKFSCICNFTIFVRIFMKFSPKCRTKILGMIFTIFGSFC